MDPLDKDIEAFFTPRVEQYLDELLQEVYKRSSYTQDREGSRILNRFIEIIEDTNLSSASLPPSLDHVSEWKRDFTKQVLLPKYLTTNISLSLDQMMNQVKKTILHAAIEKKVDYYVQLTRHRLFTSLKETDVKRRPLQAKWIVNDSSNHFGDIDVSFPRKAFLDAFQPEKLRQFLDSIPLKTLESTLLDPPLLQELDAKCQEWLDKQQATSLTKALQMINDLLIRLQRRDATLLTLVTPWFPALHSISYRPEIINSLQNVLLKAKGKLLAKACYIEISKAKARAFPEEFLRIREKALKRYQDHYIKDDLLKEHFLRAFREEESPRLPPTPIEISKPQKPPRRSFWRSI